MSENSTYPQVTVQNLSHIISEVEIEIGDGTTIRVSPDDASHYKGTIGTYGTIQTVPEDPESGDWYIIVEGGQTLDFPRGASVIRPQIGTIVVYREQDGWMCTSYTGGGGGSTDHALLSHLDFEESGHTGFQRTLSPGTGIEISGSTISCTGIAIWGSITGTLADQTDLNTALSGKQDALTAGTNISIVGSTISAVDTTYTAGTGISISSSNVISCTAAGAVWGSITGTLADQTDLNTALSGKQDALTAGTNISIVGSTISAVDTTYTAGTGIDISANDEISTQNIIWRTW